MALALKDRVKETTTTTGTGTLILVSAPSGFRRFNSVLSDGDTTYYCIESGTQWEVGIGTYSANTLARTTVLASSNANALINITASRSSVFITYAAAKAVYKDSSDRIVSGSAGIYFNDGTVQTTAASSPDLSAYLLSSTASTTYVALGGSYSNPTWITDLAWSKLSGLPSAVSNLSGTNTGDQNLSGYATTAAVSAAYLPLAGGTLTGDLKFTDATYDIGKSAATRPRDGFFSRNVTVGAVLTTASTPILATTSGTINIYTSNYAIAANGSGISLAVGGQSAVNALGSYGCILPSGRVLAWSSSTNPSDSTTAVLELYNDSSDILHQRRSTNAQTFRLAETWTSATSFGTLQIKANAGAAYQIGSAVGSAGGSNRAIQIGHWNAAGSFTSSFSVNTTANQVQIGTIVAGYNNSYSTNIYGLNLNNTTPHCTIWSGDTSAFGSSFSGGPVFMVGHDVGTLSGYGIGTYPKFVYSGTSTLSIPQICVGNPSGFSGLDLALGTTGTPSDGEYTVTSGYGTNKAGASLWLMAGRSTGSGAGGSVYIGTSNTGSSGTTRNTNLTLAQFNSTAITFSRDLLFTDATYDIGKSGATRPRDGFFSRNLTIGGTTTSSDSITTNGLFSSDRYAVSANYRFRRANGTSSSPTQVTSGQAVGALSSFGYHDSGAFHSSAGALVYFVAAENFTSTAHGTNIQFWTTPTTSTTSAKRVTIEASGELTLEEGSHIQTSGAGIKIGTATSQKIGFWNATPVVQQTTASTSATVVGGGGTTVTQTDTFDGYTLAQIVKALRTIGILA